MRQRRLPGTTEIDLRQSSDTTHVRSPFAPPPHKSVDEYLGLERIEPNEAKRAILSNLPQEISQHDNEKIQDESQALTISPSPPEEDINRPEVDNSPEVFISLYSRIN